MPRPVGLSIELLTTFVRVVDLDGDAAAAAEVLGINQPSISKRLRSLQHVGVLPRPWLERSGKTWRMTDEGQRVLPAARDLVDRYQRLQAFGEPARPQPAGVQFACGRDEAEGFVREAVRLFRRRDAQTRLQVATLSGAARIEGVANGALSFATVAHDNAAIRQLARRPLHVEPLRRERLALVCGVKSVWARHLRRVAEKRAPLEALLDVPLILPDAQNGRRRALDELLRRRGLAGRLRVEMELSGWNTILGYVLDGHGVGVLSEGAVPMVTHAGALIWRFLDPALVPAATTKLIVRHKPGSEELDLADAAWAFYQSVREAARHYRP